MTNTYRRLHTWAKAYKPVLIENEKRIKQLYLHLCQRCKIQILHTKNKKPANAAEMSSQTFCFLKVLMVKGISFILGNSKQTEGGYFSIFSHIRKIWHENNLLFWRIKQVFTWKRFCTLKAYCLDVWKISIQPKIMLFLWFLKITPWWIQNVCFNLLTDSVIILNKKNLIGQWK